MGLKFIGVFSLILCVSFGAQAETFFYKDSKGEIQKTEINFKLNEDYSIQMKPSKFLAPYTNDKNGISMTPILRREPTQAEKIADAAVTMLTALIIMSTHHTYDLSTDLRMSRMSGVIFFVFPFEFEDIYRKCNGNEYLIAVTDEPSTEKGKDETFKQLKSLDEIRKLCGSASSSKPSS